MPVAHAICQSNNYAGALGYTYGGAYGSPETSYAAAIVRCTGYETSMSQCLKIDYYGEGCDEDYTGIDCSSKYCNTASIDIYGYGFNIVYLRSFDTVMDSF